MVRVRYDETLHSHGAYLPNLKEIRIKPNMKPSTLIETFFHEFIHYLLDSLHMPRVSGKIFDYLDCSFRACIHAHRFIKSTWSDWEVFYRILRRKIRVHVWKQSLSDSRLKKLKTKVKNLS